VCRPCLSSYAHHRDGHELTRLGVQYSRYDSSMVAWMTPVNRLLCSPSVEDGGKRKRLEQLKAHDSANGRTQRELISTPKPFQDVSRRHIPHLHHYPLTIPRTKDHRNRLALASRSSSTSDMTALPTTGAQTSLLQHGNLPSIGGHPLPWRFRTSHNGQSLPRGICAAGCSELRCPHKLGFLYGGKGVGEWWYGR